MDAAVVGGPAALSLAAIYDLALAFSRAVSVKEVERVLLAYCEPFGVTSILAGIIPQKIIHPSEQPDYVIFGHWPQEWAVRYFNKQYVRKDPTILHCLTHDRVLHWSEIRYENRPTAQRIMEEAKAFKLRDGLTIPHLTLSGVRIGVSFSGEMLDKSPQAQTQMTVLAHYGVSRALEIRAATWASPVHLTARERECLRWLAEGKTAADVATILGISDKAVEKHLSSTRGKLDALNTLQAAVAATRLGLI